MTKIADERYVRLTTFTKDGRRKEMPVWIAELEDGSLGFTTEPDSWKVKRIRNTPTVELVASNVKGRVADEATSSTGQARVVTGADVDPVAAAIKAKYGFQVAMINVLQKLGRLVGAGRKAPGCAVIITLD